MSAPSRRCWQFVCFFLHFLAVTDCWIKQILFYDTLLIPLGKILPLLFTRPWGAAGWFFLSNLLNDTWLGTEPLTFWPVEEYTNHQSHKQNPTQDNTLILNTSSMNIDGITTGKIKWEPKARRAAFTVLFMSCQTRAVIRVQINMWIVTLLKCRVMYVMYEEMTTCKMLIHLKLYP